MLGIHDLCLRLKSEDTRFHLDYFFTAFPAGNGGKFARNTYKWWDAILEVKALPGLEKLKIPIYLAQGAADTSCPVESADSLAAHFRDLGKINLIYKRYPDLEHNFTDTHGQAHPEVLQDAFAWIIDQLH